MTTRHVGSVQALLFLRMLRSCRMRQCRSAFDGGFAGNTRLKHHIVFPRGELYDTYDRPLLDQTADDTQRIVDGALRLLDHQLVGASHHNAHRLTRTCAASDLDKRKKKYNRQFSTRQAGMEWSE